VVQIGGHQSFADNLPMTCLGREASLPFLRLPTDLKEPGTLQVGCHNDRQRGGYHCHSGALAGSPSAQKMQPSGQ